MPQNVDAQYVKIKAIACLRALLDATLTYTVSYKACSRVVGVAARWCIVCCSTRRTIFFLQYMKFQQLSHESVVTIFQFKLWNVTTFILFMFFKINFART